MNDPKYKINDRVEIKSFGAETETQEGIIVDIKEKKDGVDYTIQTEKVRDEKRWEDEIIRKV